LWNNVTCTLSGYLFAVELKERSKRGCFFLFQHIVEQNANTRLPQYLGMYRITIGDSDTYLIVMRNIFSPRIHIHRKYDLKVSTDSVATSFFHFWWTGRVFFLRH